MISADQQFRWVRDARAVTQNQFMYEVDDDSGHSIP